MTTHIPQQLNLFATTPKGLELLLVEELRSLGAVNPAEKLAGVTFSGDIATAYKACLWSRLANRILLVLAQVPAATPEELYAGVQTIAWDQHLKPEGTLAVHFVSSQSEINHTLFGAQKVKDAIVDQLRDKFGERPSVSREQPDVKIYVYVHKNVANISIDLSGDSLHRRGYRLAGGSAPLKENLAAAILLRAGWPEIAKKGGMLMDPMCGSGTLLIEAALMAGDIAPGLAREYFGFLGWKQHQPAIWQTLMREADQRCAQGEAGIPDMVGYDQDANAVAIAFENIERAGMLGKIHVEKRELADFVPKSDTETGLVVTNPPYGERLGEEEELQPLYTLLGERLKQGFTGWRAAVFTGNPDLGKQMGLRANNYYSLFNGPIPCKLLLFDVEPAYFVDRGPEADNARRIRGAQRAIAGTDMAAANMFANRLRKNFKHLQKQAEKKGQTAYRIYDADLPEYAFAIDIDGDKVKVQEYQAPRTVDKKKALRRQQEVLSVLPDELGVEAAQIYFSIIQKK